MGSGFALDDRAAGKPEADQAALRRLLERLRGHLGRCEVRSTSALAHIQASLGDSTGSSSSTRDGTSLRSLAAGVLDEQRSAARRMAQLAEDLRAMAEGLERRLESSVDARAVALRAMHGEVRAVCDRLDARLAAAEDHAGRALARLSAQLERWEGAAQARDRFVADEFAASLDESEVRSGRDIAALLRSMERLVEGPQGAGREAPPPRAATARGSPSRSAALLFSAGVACLGLVTLAVVLEPPVRLGSAEPAAGAEVVLRGPILIAPPRYAAEDESGLPRSPPASAPGAPDGAAAERALADALRALQAGRPGAVERLRSLAEAGLPRAQMQLAKIYELGRAGVPADAAEARRWTARAADGGDPVAMHNLALYYLKGRGGPRDDAVAARLFRRAAVAGLADSQFNLGLLYETGSGVDRNLVEAYKWFQIAANSGDLTARGRAVTLEDRLSTREMAAVGRIASRFVAGAGEPEEAVLVPGTVTIAEAQKKLARLGYYIGPTDGQDSPAYRRAVEAYRRAEAAQPATVASTGP